MIETRAQAERRLQALLLTLQYCRHALSDAEKSGKPEAIDRAREAIRIQHELIRKHCAETGLERPHDVPEED